MPSVDHLARRGLPYQLLVEQAQVNIREMRERGGGYVGLASLVEHLARVHLPVKPRTGSPCRECRQPWPCAAFALAWAADDRDG